MRFFIICCLATFAIHIYAEEPCTRFYNQSIRGQGIPAASVYAVLNSQRGTGCILGNTDSSGIEAQYQKLFQQSLDDVEIAIARGQLMDLMILEFEGLPSRICDLDTPDCVVGRHAENLKLLARNIETGRFDAISEKLDDWVPDEANGEVRKSSVSTRQFLEQQCKPDVDGLQCGTAVAIGAKVLRTSLAVDQLIVSHRSPIIGVNEQFLSGRDLEWNTYLNGASVQYPWELAVNSWRFQKSTARQENFPRAPDERIVFMHPSPAVEVIDTPASKGSAEAAIVLELAGYQKWAWHEGKQSNRWGVSAVLSLADIEGMDSIGYGVLVHTPIQNTALGVIWRDGDSGDEVGVVLNIDLARLLQQHGQSRLLRFLQK